jgi:hypothetical protein
MIQKVLLALVVASYPLAASANTETLQQPTDDSRTFVVRFPVGVSSLSEEVDGNSASLHELHDCLLKALADSSLRSVEFGAYASPEGNPARNNQLARQRAAALRQWVDSRFNISPSLISTSASQSAYDWPTLRTILQESSAPFASEILPLMTEDSISALRAYQGGQPWQWMLTNAFPQMRTAYARVVTDAPAAPTFVADTVEAAELIPAYQPSVATVAEAEAPAAFEVPDVKRPFYMDIRTNLLYDAALVPNLGIEFALGRRWSIATNWAWAWWSRNRSHRYWRVFGGEINLRRWFGSDKPLTGHHVGIYGQALTYDLMLSSSKGYLGGRPGRGVLNHPAWNVGLEYGFSLPIASRLNLDFTIGVGYFQSTYYQYTAIDSHNVWQATKKKQWVGPTKAEISLVWLLGRGNVNTKKGGLK